jgi:hypothetical protein
MYGESTEDSALTIAGFDLGITFDRIPFIFNFTGICASSPSF